MAPPNFENGVSGQNDHPVSTLAEGRPVEDPSTTLQVKSRYGGGGLALLGDTALIETLAHFPRERIPERVVHAKAAGAWGEFEVTHDISDITDAAFLTGMGKKTPCLCRISTVAGEKGSADTVRDIRGWALKLFTEEGNQDFVFNDLPVFFIRDPIKFPSMNRSHKRHPQTNIPDPNRFWDFHNHNQEGIHCLMQLFGARGVPESVRNINGFGNHTYKVGKEDGSFKYIKFHFKPDAGTKEMPAAKAAELAGSDPDYHTRDLYESIERGDYPTWTLYFQVMDPSEAETYRWNIFDMTKIWPHSDYPLRPVGRLTLNKNPQNYFQDIEQAAFSPSTMVPGVAPSADIMLQARMFSYPDAARYRLGPNYQQFPNNKPLSKVYAPFQRDGPGTINGNYGADPDYIGSQFKPLGHSRYKKDIAHDMWVGEVTAYVSEVEEDDFEQARMLWRLMAEKGEQQTLIDNLTSHMGKCQYDIKRDAIRCFARVDQKLGQALAKNMDVEI
ncbi:catalase A [Neophaeococcomyces mojaviensis]|uniref:Catalase A n=1 Tax=Neophaeococcomyces mojaviensis TaxID=3383035 RepID=A0ACC3A1I2_9EURO|nr:catalase A [Knufia sp. JES_112]